MHVFFVSHKLPLHHHHFLFDKNTLMCFCQTKNDDDEEEVYERRKTRASSLGRYGEETSRNHRAYIKSSCRKHHSGMILSITTRTFVS